MGYSCPKTTWQQLLPAEAGEAMNARSWAPPPPPLPPCLTHPLLFSLMPASAAGSHNKSTSRATQAGTGLGRGDLQLLGVHHVAVHGLRCDGCHIGLPELQPSVAFGFGRLLASRQPHVLDLPELPKEPCAAGPFQLAQQSTRGALHEFTSPRVALPSLLREPQGAIAR